MFTFCIKIGDQLVKTKINAMQAGAEQYEVRPVVSQMPRFGFKLQTGGSARKRVVKPSHTQELSDQYPKNAFYNVTGVPGHTHNSSSVLSVVCDLGKVRPRDIDVEEMGFMQNTHTLPAGARTDSDYVADEDAQFDRALERGIGEICLRPENCHDEIREPTRAIAEIRTLCAPHDQLQSLTHVQEIGGFRDADDTRFISDYPPVFVNILGTNLPLTRSNQTMHHLDRPALVNVDDSETFPYIAIYIPDHNNYVGTLDDGSRWNGLVKFEFNHDLRRYESEGFRVRLHSAVEYERFYFDPGNGNPVVNQERHALGNNFPIYIDPIESTVASEGSCFLCAKDLTSEQMLLATTSSQAAKDMKPTFTVDVHAGIHSGRVCDFKLAYGCPSKNPSRW